MKKVLYIDMDGVVVNYQSGFDFTNDKKSIGFFLNMKPMPNAIESVEILSAFYEIYFLSTAPWSNPNSWMEKRFWIEKYFPMIGYKRLILTHNKSLLKGDFLIDDRTKNGALEFEGQLILFGGDEYPDWDSCLDYLIINFSAD